MPSAQQQRERLVGLLKELFQLDQPDLDFGFWRIMHAKSKQVTEFLEKDLLAVIEDAFGKQDAARRGELEQVYQQALQSAKDFGAPEPEKAPAVGKAKAALDTYAQSASAEGEVYDHLYRFFERYYDNGDFLSRRYYSAESESKAAAYAVPYDGREVYLHWANADQYYIKTSEYFTNFTFDPTKTSEVQDHADLFAGQSLSEPLKVHFRVVEATEGEHGNVKATAEQKRFFILHEDDPIAIENGELIVRFEYRPDPEKGGQEARWQASRNDQTVEAILNALDVHGDPKAQRFAAVLRAPAPTEKQRTRPLLAKYLSQYTARNTMDYFIHKNLGGFLRRELDFYIKNEVMRLDDLDLADAPRAESYLDKVRVLREIARQIIDFLAQLEDFQKKLWLKKKFVVETNWCITLDRILMLEDEKVREALLREIAANDDQRSEWVRLFAIDRIKGDLATVAYSDPLTVEFLQSLPALVVDSRHFSGSFTERLCSALGNVDEALDGLAVQSENSQALRLAGGRFGGQIKCIYIDPPYNTDAGPIVYKNEYRSSSWVCLMDDRLRTARSFLNDEGVLCVTIDDYQVHELACLLDEVFGKPNQLGVAVIRNNPSGRSTVRGFSICHEYAFFCRKTERAGLARLPRTEKQLGRFTQENGVHVDWRNFRKDGGAVTHRSERPKQYYPLYVNVENRTVRIPGLSWNKETRTWRVLEEPQSGEVALWPIDEKGRDRVWSLNHVSAVENLADLEVRVGKEGNVQVYRRHLPSEGVLPRTWWDKKTYAAREHGSAALTNLFGGSSTFSFAKSPFAVQDSIWVGGLDQDSGEWVLDFFAGSGTTAHAVVLLNRQDGGNRRFVLVEMGDYFDTVLLPRVKKVVFSPEWKAGKPVRMATPEEVERGPQIIKVLRLESYEDCLNNLVLSEDAMREKALAGNPELRRGYMLKYMLEVETRGSESLLNIDRFADPTAYTLRVKKPGADEYVDKAVDLIETFNYLLGLRVDHMAAAETLTAAFQRAKDPELPEDQDTRLTIKGKLKRDDEGAWWFRRIEGWVPRNPQAPDDGQREKVLIIWRKLTGDLEKDNAVLDAYCLNLGINTLDFEYDTIYVNGSNNLPNLKRDEDKWKVGLIEEDFHRLMWDVEDV